ncbi:hypothetical protein DHEL01_v203311, partial [Diaporthe helianthi]
EYANSPLPYSTPLHPDVLGAAIENSQITFNNEELERNRIAKQAHNSDLYKTQQPLQGNEAGDVLILVSFPAYKTRQSCQNSTFNTARVILTSDQVLNTKSHKLKDRLNSDSYQRRAKRKAGPLPPGVTHVLDLSPSDEENDYTVALQLLSVSQGIRLWYRASAFGASLEAVAGHDDVCHCKEDYDTAYPVQAPPVCIQGEKFLEGMNFAAFLLDTEFWTIDDHRHINDFCQVRHAANVLRLFRSLANGDLHIDSAPRMWTLVGLFSMVEMTNYNLIRDEVVSWFNAGNNYIFVEILPEETLRIASIIRAPVLAFATFRILVNEHALVIAGGHVGEQARKNTTIFGRRSGCLSGTEQADMVMRMVEHAGVAMAERYKQAIDNISGPNALAFLKVPEWNHLTLLDQVIPSDKSLPVRRTYNALLDIVRAVICRFVMKCVETPSNQFLSDAARMRWAASEIGLSYLVSKRDSLAKFSLSTVYSGLSKYQRALCPFLWLELRDLFISDLTNQDGVYGAARAFSEAFKHADMSNILLPGHRPPNSFDIRSQDTYRSLFENAKSSLSDYAAAFSERPDGEFGYSITQHMVLSLSEREMDYLRFEDETVYETDIPEAELGPTGPGPAFHTGITVPSASDSVTGGMGGMAIRSEDSRSTVVGSVTAQDSFSTVYGRGRVLTPSASLPSERFTDEAMSADVAEAEYAVPAEHQSRGQALATYAEAEQEDVDDSSMGEDLPYDDDDEEKDETFMEEELSIEEWDDGDDDDDDDMEIITHDEAAKAAEQ